MQNKLRYLFSAGVAGLFFGCALPLPIVEHDINPMSGSTGAPALVEWEVRSEKIFLTQIDGQKVEYKLLSEAGWPIRHMLKFNPGRHTLKFSLEDFYPMTPDSVNFEVESGKQYKVYFEESSFKVQSGTSKTLYFNHAHPVVREGTDRIGTGRDASVLTFVPFKAKVDETKYLELYDDPNVTKEKTARLFYQRKGIGEVVYIYKVSAQIGDVNIEYQRGFEDPLKMRLLPGKYHLTLGLSAGDWSLITIQANAQPLDVTVEAGKNYRIYADIAPRSSSIEKNVIGEKSLVTTFSWTPRIEEVKESD